MPDELTPVTNIEKFLAKTAGEAVDLPEPVTRIEKYLEKISSEQSIVSTTENWLDEHIDPQTGYAVDNTLSVAGAAADAKATGDAITSQSEKIFKFTGNKEIEMTVGAYYPLSGTSINIGSPTTYATEKYALVPCSEGDIFTISGTGGQGSRPWGFVDANGVILLTAGNSKTVTIENAIAIAPANSAYLVVNNTTSSTGKSYYGLIIKDYAKEINDNLSAEIDSLHNLVKYWGNDNQELTPSGGTGASAVGIKREKNVVVVNTSSTLPTVNVRIKLNGTITRIQENKAEIDDWTGISLITGHEYLIKCVPLSGTSTAELPNAIGVYKEGTHITFGNAWMEGTTYCRQFTYDGTPVSLVLAVPASKTYTNYKCLITLQDLSAESNLQNTIVDDYDATISTANQGVNDGVKLKIVSYNVAAYNNDTSVYLPTNKEINFKKMLCEIAPDILAIQEDKPYVDSASTRLALTSLYNPIYPYEYLETTGLQCTIRSKTPATTHDLLKYSNGRWIEIATYTINGKTLLFGSTHPVANYNSTGIDSAESIAARLVQYQELVNWLNGTITLKKISDNTEVSCPSYDWCVMCGDFNTITEDDKTNFKTTVENGNFKIANGDWLGWIVTNYKFKNNPMCLDNVIVSENVIFDSIISHSNMLNTLYSDHVPFEVTVTLQDTQ